ncbi:hypothetical protein BJF92_08580 [Rhizobium rhizosphaerae]|uniref:HutD family protein n=1 Tax=Xaviernesmea rhizosphaerae TaxID=1672749 RepID=A0A1Q9AK99_9HYPH|nr:HutD family protein [Xaviernesmea rhizosphaerae]OLP55711.1 hypothetical protein BJF92_08580 [Xaviernesmea rhizosphaerae]
MTIRPTLRLQRFADHRLMPWKNGKGETREVASSEDAASGLLWRLSLATVSGSGSFSAFPGIDRTIAVMAGDGMVLTVGGESQPPLTTDTEPFAFSGDAEVTAESLGGETTDLNLMTRRGVWHHRLTRRRLTRRPLAAPLTLEVQASTAALVFSGAAQVSVNDAAFTGAFGDVLLGLTQGDRITLTEAKSEGYLFIAEFAPVAEGWAR